MFGFNKVREELKSEYDAIQEWYNTEEYKRLRYLATLITDTYGTVNIKLDKVALDEQHTRADYLEDYKVFFKPEVFDKLKDWCREYEALCKIEAKVLYGEGE